MTAEEKALCMHSSSYRSDEIHQKIPRLFFYLLNSALGYPTEIEGKSLTLQGCG